VTDAIRGHALLGRAAWRGVVVAVVVAACTSATPSGPAASVPGTPGGGTLPRATAAAASTLRSPGAQAVSSPASPAASALAAPTPEAAETVSIAVESCPTAYGLPDETLPPIGASMTATLTQAVASQVRFYSNGDLTVLGPRGWRCEAAVGADGSARMQVTPPGQAAASGSPSPDFVAVTASSGGGCLGCVVLMACGLFPESLKLFDSLGCDATSPPDERVTRPMPRTVVFEDPPGVHGTGDPSGGRYRAIGFLIFDDGSEAGASGLPSALKVTCTLPDDLAPICDEVIEGR
jgi:hypothetical protein